MLMWTLDVFEGDDHVFERDGHAFPVDQVFFVGVSLM